jgi:hypothetical protein
MVNAALRPPRFAAAIIFWIWLPPCSAEQNIFVRCFSVCINEM